MKKYLLSFLLGILCSTSYCYVDNGDTTVVQTIDYETPVLPGWNSPRAGKYKFPSADKTWSKILMYHKLKCDPNQTPKCGEWDYLTHTVIKEYTGVMDSILYTQSTFQINRKTVEEFKALYSPAYSFEPVLQLYNDASIGNWKQINSGTATSSYPFSSATNNESNVKSQYIYTKEELLAAGLAAGNIAGMQLYIAESGSGLKNLSIAIGQTELTEVPENTFVNDELSTVYNRTTSFFNTGWKPFLFSEAYNWDGNSNLIISIAYDRQFSDTPTKVKCESISNKGLVNDSKDTYGDFGQDLVDVPANVFDNITNEITISFWAKGGEKNPKRGTILKGINTSNQRKINIHLPWENGMIYFDCGANEGEDGYDRIEFEGDPNLYKGKWTHWVFTKNSANGVMRVFVNGELRKTGTAKKRSIENITQFYLGCTSSGKGEFYDGGINDFRIYNKYVSPEEAEELYSTSDVPDSFVPNTILDYSFDDFTDTHVVDNSSSEANGLLIGKPQIVPKKAKEKHFAIADNTRPLIQFSNDNFDNNAVTQVASVDTTMQDVNMLHRFENGENPGVPYDTSYIYQEYYTYVFDNDGVAIDSTLVPADETLVKEEFTYYGKPFEVTRDWEIGRFITPYGNGLDLQEGWTWIYDVTDFAHLLHDSVYLKAGNFQELLDLKFIMIEGTPPRDVLKVTPLWNGNYQLSEFAEKVPAKTIALHEETESCRLKLTTTGHGFGQGNNCAEFCHNLHSVKVNGAKEFEWDIIQECGDNHLYPQGGTWVYDRAGWCPGLEGNTRNFELTEYLGSRQELELDYDCQYDPHGNYVVQTYLVEYGEHNFSYDVAVKDVLNPNNVTRYDRFNPNCGAPRFIFTNYGSETITSMTVKYKVDGFDEKEYMWIGEVNSNEEELITLPALPYEETLINGQFHITLEAPNGNVDENTINNHYKTFFKATPSLSNKIVVEVKANKRPYENNYYILNSAGDIVLERDDLEYNAIYKDTLTLSKDCYYFYIEDTGNDGLYWWANTAQGSGYIKFKTLDGETIYNPTGDFGKYCSFSFIGGFPVNTHEFGMNKEVVISPNPSENYIRVYTPYNFSLTSNYMIINEVGQTIKSGEISRGNRIDTSLLPQGSYILQIEGENGNEIKEKFIKL